MALRQIISNKSFQLAVALVAIGVIFRLLPHEANFAPVAALSLLAGALLGWRYALAVPLGIMLISDLVIGFYSSMAFTWLGFLLIAAFGMLFRKSSLTKRVVLGSLGSAVIFFVVSNLGVWLMSGMYQLNLAGLVECFTLALPFFRATLLSDIVYSGVFFSIVAVCHFVVNQHKDSPCATNI